MLAAVLLCGIISAQEIYATLTGTVTDQTGALAQGAAVTIHNNDTNTDFRTVQTDGSGNSRSQTSLLAFTP